MQETRINWFSLIVAIAGIIGCISAFAIPAAIVFYVLYKLTEHFIH